MINERIIQPTADQIFDLTKENANVFMSELEHFFKDQKEYFLVYKSGPEGYKLHPHSRIFKGSELIEDYEIIIPANSIDDACRHIRFNCAPRFAFMPEHGALYLSRGIDYNRPHMYRTPDFFVRKDSQILEEK